MEMPSFPHFATDALHVGQDPERWNIWGVVPPISMSTTFKQSLPEVHKVSPILKSSHSVIIIDK